MQVRASLLALRAIFERATGNFSTTHIPCATCQLMFIGILKQTFSNRKLKLAVSLGVFRNLNVSRKDREFVSFNPAQCTTNFLHEFWVLFAWVLAVCACIKRMERSDIFKLNMHTLPPSRIHSSAQFPTWWLARSPTPACWANFAGSTPE